MKKYIIAGVLVVAFIAYLVFANKNPAPVAVVTPATTPVTGPTSTPSATGPTSLPPTSTTPATGNPPTGTGSGSTSTGQYKDGTYTGTVANAFYGNLQAVVTISGGMITDVTFPQAPSGGHSSQVSAFALPALKQEAIAAQSANVNIVSGATQDSQAFQQSLASALAQAKS
jgi:uncharacterized protein with FMN-binding domain